jgi:TDG/mug DNA glycosylase family protein
VTEHQPPIAELNRDTMQVRKMLRSVCMSSAMTNNNEYAFNTLPDHLRRGLDLVFIGINPGTYSVERGHYFARKTSRFWPAFSKSKLSEEMRRELGVDVLLPEHDVELTRFGIGLTDVIKRPSANASALKPSEFKQWVPHLVDKLRDYRPRVACFHGLTGFRPFLRFALGRHRKPSLGPQPEMIGPTRLFVVPNPSPANAHFTPKQQAEWYDRVAEYVATASLKCMTM